MESINGVSDTSRQATSSINREVKEDERNVRKNPEKDTQQQEPEAVAVESANQSVIKDGILRFEVIKQVNADGKVEEKVVVSVLDEETGKVVRRIPPEELKQNLGHLSKLMGLMVDEVG